MEFASATKSCFRAVLIITSCVTYTICIAVSVYLDSPFQHIFNTTHVNLSYKYPIPISPTDATFFMWVPVFVWGFISAIYCMTLLCRKCNGKPLYVYPGVVPTIFFVFFIANAIMANLVWSVVFLEDYLVLVFLLSVFGLICLLVCLVSSCKELEKSSPILEENGCTADIWCTRIIVQNGLALYLPWAANTTTVAGMVSFHYVYGVSMTTCCFTALLFMNTVIVGWFILELVYDRQMRYIFVHYLTYIITFYGICKRNYNPDVSYEVYALVILYLAIVLTVVKLIIMIVRSVKDPIHYPQSTKNVKFEPLKNDVIAVQY